MKYYETHQTSDLMPPVRLKILFLSHSFYPEIGGIETISDILATTFIEAGHEVHLLTWSREQPGGKTFPFNIIRQPGFRTLFREHAWADVVFENNPCLRMAWVGVFFKRKSIIGLQTWISRGNGKIGWRDSIKFIFLRRALSIISCSNAIRDKYAPGSIVIGNPYKEDVFKMLAQISKSLDFVFLGRLVSDKGADIVIKAISQLKTEREINSVIPNTLSLTIVGDGPDRKRLEEMSIELGLERNIKFTGSLSGSELVNCLNQHRFMVVPSRWDEPFGIVALEGMACGCLPIVSNCGGLPDAVGQAGLLFKKGDVVALVNCIRSILNNSQEETRLRETVSTHLAGFRSSEVSRRYLEVFENVFLKAV